MNKLNVKETIIIFFRFGYIDGKCFSVSSIAKFLDMTDEEVNDVINNALLLYKDIIEEDVVKIKKLTKK